MTLIFWIEIKKNPSLQLALYRPLFIKYKYSFITSTHTDSLLFIMLQLACVVHAVYNVYELYSEEIKAAISKPLRFRSAIDFERTYNESYRGQRGSAIR